MSSNFIIAFGGTGARAVEAVSHLMAAGALDANCRILLIDLDREQLECDQSNRANESLFTGSRATRVSA